MTKRLVYSRSQIARITIVEADLVTGYSVATGFAAKAYAELMYSTIAEGATATGIMVVAKATGTSFNGIDFTIDQTGSGNNPPVVTGAGTGSVTVTGLGGTSTLAQVLAALLANSTLALDWDFITLTNYDPSAVLQANGTDGEGPELVTTAHGAAMDTDLISVCVAKQDGHFIPFIGEIYPATGDPGHTHGSYLVAFSSSDTDQLGDLELSIASTDDETPEFPRTTRYFEVAPAPDNQIWAGKVTVSAGNIILPLEVTSILQATAHILRGALMHVIAGTGRGQTIRIQTYDTTFRFVGPYASTYKTPLNNDSYVVLIADEAVAVAAMDDDTVTAAAIANNAIDATSIATGAITNAKFAAGAIDAAAIADNAIDAGAIASNAITSAKIASSAIGATQIATGAITNAKFAAGAIDAAAIATNAIDADALATDAVTEIQSGLATSSALSAISARIPAALAGGRMDSSVGAYQSGLAPLQPTVSGRTLDVSAAGNAGIDWSNIEAPTTTVNLSGTTIKDAADVPTVAEMIAALMAFAFDDDATVQGLLMRLEAAQTGKATGLKNTGTVEFYLRDGVTVAFSTTQNVTSGTRGESDISGSE